MRDARVDIGTTAYEADTLLTELPRQVYLKLLNHLLRLHSTVCVPGPKPCRRLCRDAAYFIRLSYIQVKSRYKGAFI